MELRFSFNEVKCIINLSHEKGASSNERSMQNALRFVVTKRYLSALNHCLCQGPFKNWLNKWVGGMSKMVHQTAVYVNVLSFGFLERQKERGASGSSCT